MARKISRNASFWLKGEEELKKKYPDIFKDVCENFYWLLNNNPFLSYDEALKKSFPLYYKGNEFPKKIKDDFYEVYVKNASYSKIGCP